MQDSVNFIGPPTIEQFAEEKCLEVEILKKELSKAREKEYVFTFGLNLNASQKTRMIFTSTLVFQIMKHL